MLCDYLAMYLMELAEEQHIYAGIYGVRILQELRQIFDPFIKELLNLDRKKIILLYSDQTEANSSFIYAQQNLRS
jgi:hypothetical protein